MIDLLFGERNVGTISESEGTGLGKPLFEVGFDSVFDLKHHAKEDADFEDALLAEFSGGYFKAVKR